uniref:Protein kinase domain-containing protein n=1 Tax=Macrostomum lignano TaxID=282301 RepID=A0A1I8I0P1_9PLAT
GRGGGEARRGTASWAARRKAACRPDNYDKFYTNMWDKQKRPLPATIKSHSVFDDYEILERLGSGAFGVVHRCKELSTGQYFVAKFIQTPTAIEKQTVRQEVAVMNALHHSKLINLHDVYESVQETVLIVEFLSGGDLFDRVADDSYKMTEAEVIKYIRQVCEGLLYMHEQGYVHLDIKPENIICETSKSTNIKLVDFGLTTRLDPNEPVKVTMATAEFAAPEIAEHEPVGFYTDMWAVGVLAYVLLSGLSPFLGNDSYETLANVRRCEWEFQRDAFSSVSDDAKDFIKNLLVRRGEKRLTVHEALEHPWLLEGRSLDGLDKRIAASKFEKLRQRAQDL